MLDRSTFLPLPLMILLVAVPLSLDGREGSAPAAGIDASASHAHPDHHRRGPAGVFSARGPVNVDAHGIALHGYDVVAYFTEGRPVEGSAQFEATYLGATFRFASREHRKRFLHDPQRHMPAYGGFCSLGVASGYKDGMHPDAFSIVDGRLFFNLTPQIHRFWEHRREQLIERADANWPAIRDARAYGPGLGRI